MTAVHLPPERRAVAEMASLTKRAATAGYDGVWFGEVNNLDAVVPATLAASADAGVDIGLLLNVYTRAPATIAMTAATLADAAPGHAVVVLGVASPLLVERWNGIPYGSPSSRLADVTRFLRRALGGERCDGDYATFSSGGFALAERPDDPPRILIATTGPRGLEQAAREADGVVVNWMTPADVERLPGLPTDRTRVELLMPVCPSPDSAAVDQRMRPIVSDYLCAPGYAGLQRRLGRGHLLEPMWAAFAAGDRRGARAALPAELIAELVISGTPQDCRHQLWDIEAACGVRTIAAHFPLEGQDFATAAALQ
jgi:probable F420-dependent oxidoreductase